MTGAEMLERVRRALAGVVPPSLPRVDASPPSARSDDPSASLSAPLAEHAQPVAHASTRELLRRFTVEASAVGAVVHLASDVSAAGTILASVARLAPAPPRIVAWRTALVTAALDGARAALPDLAVSFADEADLPIAEAEIGVTEVDVLIAASGTLVLGAAGERHRATSLLPRVHVALAPVDRLVANLAAALRVVSAAVGGPCTTLVTGPSRTADIEKKLVLGVHGPCELHVIVLGVAPDAGEAA